MKIRPLASSDIPQLFDLWQRRWGQLFPLDQALWNQQTSGDPQHYRPDLSCVLYEAGLVGFIGVKTPPPIPAWPKQDPQSAWISYLLLEPGREELGKKLLEHSLNQLEQLGYHKVAYGSDPWHFFPGLPLEDSPLEQLLLEAGFEAGGVAQDFHRILGNYQVPTKAIADLEKSGFQITPCGLEDVPRLLSFLAETFPGRWYYETVRRLQSELEPSNLLLLKSQQEVLGFCHLYPKHSRRIGPGLYWLRAFSPNPGGLGPIGVSEKVRGMGLGMALLGYGVERLKDLGAEEIVIDWTTLADFYGKLGFGAWRGYKAYWKLLGLGKAQSEKP